MKFNDWIGLLSLVASIIILWQFRQIVLLVFTAVVIATALNSLVRLLMRKFNLSRNKSILITLVLIFIISTFLIIFIIPPFVGQFQELIQLIPIGFRQLLEWGNSFLENPPLWFSEFDSEWLPNVSEIVQQLRSLAPKVFSNFLSLFSNSTGVILQLLLIFVLTLMFLAEPLAYRNLLLQLLPSSYRKRAREIISMSEASLLAWLRGVAIQSLFVAILCALGLLFLRIPFVFANTILAGIFNFIPNIGPTLSAIFPIAIALLSSPGQAIAVLVWYTIVQQVETYWLGPMVMKKQVDLLPAATLIIQIFFTTFFGFLGLVLALPLSVVIKTWVQEALIKDVLNKK